MKKFITFHILTALPNHNLNRDQSGQPKSQFDGGVQRSRLSSQALKRAARVAFRDGDSVGSIRTKYAASTVLDIAREYAEEVGVTIDEKKVKQRAGALIKGLTTTKASKNPDEVDEKKDSILLFSLAEVTSLAHTLVEAQREDAQPVEDKDIPFILDASSPSLDVAAFGRMFAERSDLSTHAAIAVSHAITTHKMTLTTDYFTAVDENPSAAPKAGASHLGLNFFTSGVYYRTFTLDIDQLKRSWSGFGKPGSDEAIRALLTALVLALPSGKVTTTNAHALPTLVLAEQQSFRNGYSFETPISAAAGGGYEEPSVKRLAEQRALALDFSPENFGPSAFAGNTFGHSLQAHDAGNLSNLINQVVSVIATR